jgi:CubicO group peptidase (beta-lactamase class C family)
MKKAYLLFSLLSVFLLTIATQPAMAQALPAQADLAGMEAFLDGVLGDQLAAYHIPGAVVTVVQGGETLFSRGYGYADLARWTPMDPDETIVRMASVSKLFTWTAAMQLVEAGQLDLHTDVNTYLDAFQIPDTYLEPITLWHLMNHTAGFESHIVGVEATDPADLQPLGTYLAARMPARVRSPGELSAYSNYGAALAGYIVAQAAETSFPHVIEEQIFQPLEMEHSTFVQPLPAGLTGPMATGYTFANGAYQPVDFELAQGGPAGAMSATATDVARFMIAHLQEGRYADARILQEDTAREMHRQQFAHDPRVSGWTLGFMEVYANGQRLIWHGGDMIGFHAALALLPEHDVGLFVAYNGPDGARARLKLLYAFLDQYYPAPTPPPPEAPAGFEDRAGRFAGEYVPTTGVRTEPLKLVQLLNRMSVGTTGEGTLHLTGPGVPSSQWVEREPLVYRSLAAPDSVQTVVFAEDPRGRVDKLFLENDPTLAFLRVPWHASSTLHFGLLGSALALYLSAFVGWPISYLANQHRPQSRSGRARWARWIGWAMSGLGILLVVGLVLLLGNVLQLTLGLPPAAPVILSLPLLIAPLALLTAVLAVLAWRHRDWTVGARIHYTALAFFGLGFVWWTYYWNLLSVGY